MRDYLVETSTVAPRPTAVVRQTTTWEEFPRLWSRLLDEAHGAVHRFAAERGLELAGPRWEIYGHPGEDPSEIEIEVSYLLTAS